MLNICKIQKNHQECSFQFTDGSFELTIGSFCIKIKKTISELKIRSFVVKLEPFQFDRMVKQE